MKNLVIYHNDLDGFAGAYAAWRANGDRAAYFGYSHDSGEEKLSSALSEAGMALSEIGHVFFIDLQPSDADLEAMTEAKVGHVILDHHPPLTSDRAACVLAWQFFHPEAPIPWFVEVCEDYDLWRFAIPSTKILHLGLTHWVHRDFEAWDTLHDPDMKAEVATVGEHMDLLRARQVEAAAGRVMVAALRFGGQLLAVNVVQASVWPNETAHAVLEAEEGAFGLVAVVMPLGGKLEFCSVSLRSSPDFEHSCGDIAKEYGGGGHRHAAGFRGHISVFRNVHDPKAVAEKGGPVPS